MICWRAILILIHFWFMKKVINFQKLKNWFFFVIELNSAIGESSLCCSSCWLAESADHESQFCENIEEPFICSCGVDNSKTGRPLPNRYQIATKPPLTVLIWTVRRGRGAFTYRLSSSLTMWVTSRAHSVTNRLLRAITNSPTREVLHNQLISTRKEAFKVGIVNKRSVRIN